MLKRMSPSGDGNNIAFLGVCCWLSEIKIISRKKITSIKSVTSLDSIAPQRVYITMQRSFRFSMFGLPIFFRFGLAFLVGATVVSVANSKKDFALLAGTFLVGLGTLEAVLHAFGG